MPIKIKKSVLKQIVTEELRRHFGQLLDEAPEVHDADHDGKNKERTGKKAPPEPHTPTPPAGKKSPPGRSAPEPEAPPEDPDTKAAPPPGKKGKDVEPPTQELPDDPADDELEKDAEDDAEGKDDEEQPTDRISSKITGKNIQSITAEPKSKIMPGAQEIVITFREIPDTFRIIITKSGKVAYYFRGLHNEL